LYVIVSYVYLTSEISGVGAILGKLPTTTEYMEYASQIDAKAADIYGY